MSGIWDQIIEHYLEGDKLISEIEANGTRSLFFRRAGKRIEQTNAFPSVQDYVDSIPELVGRIKYKYNPDLEDPDEFLEEGTLHLRTGGLARVHIVMPPASEYPLVTIARKTEDLTTLEDICHSGSMSMKMMNFVEAAMDCRLTTVFSGSTGAGKALHKNTLIPTESGFKSVLDVQIGDVLFDKNGNKTKVLEKFHPRVSRAYKILFDNGEEIETCEDHLWETVSDGVIDTGEIYKKCVAGCAVKIPFMSHNVSFKDNPEEESKYTFFVMGSEVAKMNEKDYCDFKEKEDFPNNIIRLSKDNKENFVQGFNHTDDTDFIYSKEKLKDVQSILASMGQKSKIENQKIALKENNDFEIACITMVENPNEDDYYCFKVDSPSHTFCCGRTFIPTHNTTFLEAATKLWPSHVRVGVVEDAPELRLIQPNVVYLKSSVRKPGVGENEIATLDWCVAQLNRMRADLIIVGETRGKEFASFLTAANSGCEGSLTTIHAANPKMALQKMNQFVNQAYSSPQRVINQNIAATIDIIIQLHKTPEGRYRTLAIEEVTQGLSQDESASIVLSPIFTYKEKLDDWEEFPVSDHLRSKLIANGYDPKKFIKRQRPPVPRNKRPANNGGLPDLF